MTAEGANPEFESPIRGEERQTPATRWRQGLSWVINLLQKLQAIVWAATIIAATMAGYISLSIVEVPEDRRADVFLASTIFFAVMSSFQTAYIIHIRDQRGRLRLAQRNARQINQSYILKESIRDNIERSDDGIDEQIARMLKRRDLDQREKLRRSMEAVLLACRDNALPDIEPTNKRFAFLEYDELSGNFEVLAEIGLVDESYICVRTGLKRGHGLAARAIQLHETQYIEDITLPEAQRKGYVYIGADKSRPRKFSIMCVEICVDERPIGVISADSQVKRAFSDDDQKILERFATKARLAYSAFAENSE